MQARTLTEAAVVLTADEKEAKLTEDFFAPYYRRPHQRGSWQPKGLSEGFFHASSNRPSVILREAKPTPSPLMGESVAEKSFA
jgi:hypothetical protein